MAPHRHLSFIEIDQLETQHCTSDNWNFIFVREHFTPNNIFHTHFSGRIELGEFEQKHILPGGYEKLSGIYNSNIHNCKFGNNVLIERSNIANYNIGENTIIRNISELYVEGVSSFGNGIKVEVLNETGGREVVIFNQLSAQCAYLQAFYRDRPQLISILKNQILDYVSTIISEQGRIGKNSIITNCSTLKNINVGDAATLHGIIFMENGTVDSTIETPTVVSDGVFAKNFIISSGAKVESGASITNTFIGQAVHLANGFSATNSLFFSHSQGEQGEACAIFAGPFTVSHHKSTLLIGGYYSYLNAGSGTNQSNHLYRLGPSHQGIVERGGKCASDSYILWPSRIGAFSLISGRHVNHIDSSDLPFSYLLENNGETFIVPGATLRNVGTMRDAQKWIKRDTLSCSKRLDRINSALFSPYSMQKVTRAIDVLKKIQDEQGLMTDLYQYNGSKINASSLRKGISIYEISLIKYIGDIFLEKLANVELSTFNLMLTQIAPNDESGIDKWLDVSGLLAPQKKVESVISQIENEEITHYPEIEKCFEEIHQQYQIDEWSWVINQMESIFGKEYQNFTAENVSSFIDRYIKSMELFYQNMLEDAKKEFTNTISIGFGIDGDETCRRADFEAVRGRYEDHPVIKDLMQQIESKRDIANLVSDKIKEQHQ